jgi:hypothetical protein
MNRAAAPLRCPADAALAKIGYMGAEKACKPLVRLSVAIRDGMAPESVWPFPSIKGRETDLSAVIGAGIRSRTANMRHRQ